MSTSSKSRSEGVPHLHCLTAAKARAYKTVGARQTCFGRVGYRCKEYYWNDYFASMFRAFLFNFDDDNHSVYNDIPNITTSDTTFSATK